MWVHTPCECLPHVSAYPLWVHTPCECLPPFECLPLWVPTTCECMPPVSAYPLWVPTPMWVPALCECVPPVSTNPAWMPRRKWLGVVRMKGQRGGFHQAPYLSCLVKLLLASISPLNGKGWVVIAEEEKCMPLTGWIYCRNFNRRWDNCLCVKLQTQLWLINDLKVKECCYPFVPPPPPPPTTPRPRFICTVCYSVCPCCFYWIFCQIWICLLFQVSDVAGEHGSCCLPNLHCQQADTDLQLQTRFNQVTSYTVNRQTQIFSCRQDLIR